MHQYVIHHTYDQTVITDGGVKEMVKEVTARANSYEKIYIPNDPYIFFLFYNRVPVDDFLANSSIRTESVGNWERVEKFDNIIFQSEEVCPEFGQKKSLYVCKTQADSTKGKLLTTIYHIDKRPAFLLVEY